MIYRKNPIFLTCSKMARLTMNLRFFFSIAAEKPILGQGCSNCLRLLGVRCFHVLWFHFNICPKPNIYFGCMKNTNTSMLAKLAIFQTPSCSLHECTPGFSWNPGSSHNHTRVDRKVGLKIKLKGFFKDRGLNPSSRTAVKPAGRWKRAAWKSSLSNWYGATDLFLSFWKQKKKTKARARNSETKLFDQTFGSLYNPVGISNVPHLLTWTDHLNSFWQLSSLTFLIFWNLQYLLVSFCQLMIAAPNPMPGSLQPHPRQIAWYEGPACLAVPAFFFEHDLKWCGKETIYHIWLMDSKTYPFKPHRGWFPQVHFEISGWFNVSGLGHGGRIANQW